MEADLPRAGSDPDIREGWQRVRPALHVSGQRDSNSGSRGVSCSLPRRYGCKLSHTAVWVHAYGEHIVGEFDRREDMRRLSDAQRHADRTVKELMDALATCTPAVRREFHMMLSMLDGTDSLVPISPTNPFGERLQEIRNGWEEQG